MSRFFIGFFALALIWSAQALAQSGLPVPRFVSLRADEVRLRTGPGVRYPIDWVYQRRWLPVEVISEYDTWRKVRDIDGATGWMHQSMLSGRRSVLISGQRAALRLEPADTAPLVAEADPGVLGTLDECRQAWCLVTMAGIDGWVRREALWGVYPEEELD